MRTGRWTRTAAAVLTGLLVVACSAEPDPGSDPDGGPSPEPTSPSSTQASPGGPPSPGPSTAESPGAQGVVPVYWIGDSAQRAWLYREFRTLPEHPQGRVAAAVQALFGAQPVDPDYRSGWTEPLTEVTVEEAAEGITVDLPADAVAELDVASPEGNVTLQQLVWTVTAAAESDVGVTITTDGEPFVDALERDPAIRGQVWVITPQQGGTLQRPVVIEGTATSFEGTLGYEITAGGSVVDSGTTTGGANGDFAEFTIEAGLEPGEYTVSVFGTDPSGGESGEGEQPFADTKDFVVED
ncbi:MAG: Gmad2 immunoglobulin-like domain-containing protein [Propionibacteriaceae bacterium]